MGKRRRSTPEFSWHRADRFGLRGGDRFRAQPFHIIAFFAGFLSAAAVAFVDLPVLETLTSSDPQRHYADAAPAVLQGSSTGNEGTSIHPLAKPAAPILTAQLPAEPPVVQRKPAASSIIPRVTKMDVVQRLNFSPPWSSMMASAALLRRFELVILRQLPAGSTLSRGEKLSDTEWAFVPAEAGDIELTLGNASAEELRIIAEFHDKRGGKTGSLTLKIKPVAQATVAAPPAAPAEVKPGMPPVPPKKSVSGNRPAPSDAVGPSPAAAPVPSPDPTARPTLPVEASPKANTRKAAKKKNIEPDNLETGVSQHPTSPEQPPDPQINFGIAPGN